MAISARLSQLLEARKASSALRRFGGSTRVLLGGSSLATQTATLAKNAATSELSDKINQYNDGLISNEDMMAFLTKMSGNTTLSVSERSDIQAKMRDFQDKISVGKLETAYKSASPNSIEKVQAAQALASYYSSKASGQMPGTPAQSDALTAAAQWNTQAETDKNSIEKYNRSVKRANLFNDVYKQTPNSSAESYQKYLAYSELASQAANDGDTLAASQFQSQAQQAYSDYTYRANSEGEQATKEQSATQRKKINDYINTTMNDYRDGKISGEQAIANLNEADSVAAELGETGIQVRLNTLATGVYRDLDKGISYTTEGAFGEKSGSGGGGDIYYDPTTGQVYAGGGGGGTTRSSGGSSSIGGVTGVTGNTKTQYSPAAISSGKPQTIGDYEKYYQEQVLKAHDAFIAGQLPNGQPYDSASYMKTLAALSVDRAKDLQNIVTGLDGVNPKAKLTINGETKTAATVKSDFAKQLQEAQIEAQQFKSGGLVPVLVEKATDSNGFVNSKPELQFKSASEIKSLQQNYVQDDQGVYHLIKEDSSTRQYLSPDQLVEYQALNPKAKIVRDNQGNAYLPGRKYVDVYDTNGNKVSYEYSDKYGYLPIVTKNPTLKSGQRDTIAESLQKYRDSIIKQADEATKSGKTPQQSKLLSPGGLQLFVEGSYKKPVESPIVKKTATPGDKYTYSGVIPTLKDKIMNLVQPTKVDFGANQGLQPVQAIASTTKVEQPKVVSASYVAPKLDVPANMPIGNAPIAQTLKQTTAQSGSPSTGMIPQGVVQAQPKVQLAAPQQNAIQKAVAQNPQNKISIPQSAGPVQLLKQTQPKQYTWNDLFSGVKSLATKIFKF